MKRKVPLWATVTIGIVALVIGIAAGSGSKMKDKNAAASVATTVTAPAPAGAAVTVTKTQAAPAAAAVAPVTVTETVPAASSAAPAGIGDGTYVVGTDIKPGLYKTTGPSDSSLPNCYWERDRDLSGGMDSIIANDNPKGQTTVQIASSDKAFKTSGCAPWVKVG